MKTINKQPNKFYKKPQPVQRQQPQKNKQEKPPIEVKAEMVEDIPVVQAQALEPVQSKEQKLEELQTQREIKQYESRLKDLELIDNMDRVAEIFMNALLDDDGEKLRAFVDRVVRGGKGRDLKDMMLALGVALDKRDKLLGFDEHRAKQQKKTKFQVLFKGNDGTQAGVSVETE